MIEREASVFLRWEKKNEKEVRRIKTCASDPKYFIFCKKRVNFARPRLRFEREPNGFMPKLLLNNFVYLTQKCEHKPNGNWMGDGGRSVLESSFPYHVREPPFGLKIFGYTKRIFDIEAYCEEEVLSLCDACAAAIITFQEKKNSFVSGN